MMMPFGSPGGPHMALIDVGPDICRMGALILLGIASAVVPSILSLLMQAYIVQTSI